MDVEYTAQLLYKAVKKAAISPDRLGYGDLIIVTGAENDTVGIVDALQNAENDTIALTLHTATGLKTLKVSDKTFVHLIKRADMLNLREHREYERDLKDMTKDTHTKERPEHGPITDSEKSVLPTSKVSLNLRQSKQDD